MTQEFDPAALLAEWTRVHEAASNGRWILEHGEFSGKNWLIAYTGDGGDRMNCHVTTDNVRASETNGADGLDDATAIAHYHNTYGALLEVARATLDHRHEVRSRLALFTVGDVKLDSASAAEVTCLRVTLRRLDETLARLAAGGGGT